ncbi:shugoshin-like protein [Cordyceps javanica]|uniref:Shugoshin-like protein n=1 Tax=Cordyceps javanica TaxID=43265 RepID=A0A545VP72_9HYPO|nr:shugoshin-like protein [Cordyceps javanica]TQW03530.1 shugoshin-like protein [Cordyceps javanica]
MARLNEPALSTDSIEILRKKMLRQNRELAKTNNVRALRIRELESELSRALTENLELRGRIVELEQETRENDARRAHTMQIRKALESQLTEWCTLVGCLGTEPPALRRTPPAASTTKTRVSFTTTRPSPSQRRLRDIANDIEQLGHIAEHKAYSRKSMNPEQIQALRSEVDYEEAPELPPPTRVARHEIAKPDTPPRESRARNFTSGLDSSPLVVSSPNLDNLRIGSAPPTTSVTPMIRESRVHVDPTPDTPIAPPTKAGSKRKFSRDQYEPITLEKITNENAHPGVETKRVSILNKARGKTLKELAAIRREEMRTQVETARDTKRMPLATMSTNDDVQSPKKRRTAPVDKISSLKTTLSTNPAKPRFYLTVRPERARAQEAEALMASIESSRLATGGREYVRDTPPPTDIGSSGEASRPSRRSRAAISYAEPNLRDKMRRPRNETFDAVSGEGKSRRFSHSELSTLDIKRESSGSESWKKAPAAHQRVSELSAEGVSVSPLSGHAQQPHELPSTVQADRRQRSSRPQALPVREESDVYEFTSSSPYADGSSGHLVTRRSGRRTTAPRRFSTIDDDDHGVVNHDRITTRRRSMMV